MKKIPLTQGKFALVGNEDYDWLSKWNWCVSKRGSKYYAIRRKGSKPGIIVYMHREILGLIPDLKVMADHIDNNGLNNQRCNLRTATRSQNAMNGAIRKNKLSKYKGVAKHRGKWTAHICKDGQGTYLGIFNKEEDAAAAYNKAAILLFGEFSNLNKVTA